MRPFQPSIISLSIIISSFMDDIQASTIKPKHKATPQNQQDCNSSDPPSDLPPQSGKPAHHTQGQKLDFGFEESSLFPSGHQLPSYLSLIKYLAIFLLLLSLAFTLPLCIIIINNRSSNSSISDSPFTLGLSVFSLLTGNAIDILAYLAIPFFFLHMLLIILLTLKLQHIEGEVREKGFFPTSYALLFRFPGSTLSETDISKQIQAWFTTEMRLNKQFFDNFPELLGSLDKSSESQWMSSHMKGKEVDSLFIQSILLSYNYEQYIKLRQEVDYLTSCIKEESASLKQEQIQNLIEIYNKKKNILNVLPKNEYCLVIFKKARYADYFYQKTSGNLFNNFFCPESYCSFELSGESIDIHSQVFPNEINWQQLHESACDRIKYRLFTVAMNTLVIGVGVAFQFGSIFLLYHNIVSSDFAPYHHTISALLINFLVFLANKILHHFSLKQVHPFYSKQKKSFIFQALLSNVAILTISPLCISFAIDSAIIYNSYGFISSQLFTLLFYAIFSVINIYTCSSQNNKENSDGEGNHEHKIDYLLVSHLTILSVTYFIAPFYPIIIPMSVLWFFPLYLLERYNIAHYYNRGEYHGIKLIGSMTKYMKTLSFLLISGISFIYFFATIKFSYHWPLSAIIILPLLTTVFLFFQFFNFRPHLRKFLASSKRKQSLLSKAIGDEYSKAKERFVILYETFNFALSYTLKQNKRQNSYSARIKIYEQMNTMSKTLSQSLKERLFSNLAPIMNNERRIERAQEHDIYFEYEKKIHMNKITPKVLIPPLFKKEEPIQPSYPEDNMEMMNFNSIFSSDDKEARKVLKKHILNKLSTNIANK